MRIGRFEVIEELGRGGMGVVCRAWDPGIGRAVAIKKLTHASEEALVRFRQEALAAGRLQHPNITTVYESGDEQGEPYLVMEFLDGESLKSRMRGGTLPPIDERLRVVADIALGLAHAHANGVAVHRDIKPANIQITSSGIAKVMDFGIAKLADDLKLARSLTEANTVLGTLFYMSPEQIRGEKLDGRSDIWSLGVVLWELLWGTRPFDDEDDNEVMKKIVLADLPEPPRIGIHEEDAVVRIVRRALEKDRDRRYRDAGELARDLELAMTAMREQRGQPVVARERTAEEYFEEGHRLYEAEAYGRAAEAFRHALELAPGSRPARQNLAICEAAQRKRHIEELYRLGVLLFKNREYGLAVSALEELVGLEPTRDDARTLIVWARRELRRDSERGALDALVEDTLDRLLESEIAERRMLEETGEIVTPAVPTAEMDAESLRPADPGPGPSPEPSASEPPPTPVLAGRDRPSGKIAGLLKRWFSR